jgi:putative transcriptional regulator
MSVAAQERPAKVIDRRMKRDIPFGRNVARSRSAGNRTRNSVTAAADLPRVAQRAGNANAFCPWKRHLAHHRRQWQPHLLYCAIMAIGMVIAVLMFFMAYVPAEPSVLGMGMMTTALGCGVYAGSYLMARVRLPMSSQGLENTLRVHRALRNLTQAEHAGLADMTRASVNAIEGGRMVPSVLLALRLAAALEVRVEDLFKLQTARPKPGHRAK